MFSPTKHRNSTLSILSTPLEEHWKHEDLRVIFKF